MTLSANPSDPGAAAPIALPVHATTVCAEELKVRLVLAADLGGAVHVDAGSVDSVGQAAIQLLLAARGEAMAEGRPFLIVDPSPAFLARITALGLTEALGLSSTRELLS